jgi:hypothetical protein
MDLYVKLWGLKSNFEKVQGVKYKNTKIQNFLEFINYFPIRNRVD